MGRERAIRHLLLISVVMASASTVSAFADGTITFGLPSSSVGATVSPDVDWVITATLSTGDNAALALVSVDLVQDVGKLELFDMPQAAGVPVAREGFNRPAGISYLGPAGSGSGGTAVGPEGARNFLQIGGMQNTFGAPSDGNGQSPGGQEAASDSFPAPATLGVYTFWIQSRCEYPGRAQEEEHEDVH